MVIKFYKIFKNSLVITNNKEINSLNVSYHDFLNISLKGRWWITGAVYNPIYQDANDAGDLNA